MPLSEEERRHRAMEGEFVPPPPQVIEARLVGNRYVLVVDGIHRGFLGDDVVAWMLTPKAHLSSHTMEVTLDPGEQVFTRDNPPPPSLLAVDKGEMTDIDPDASQHWTTAPPPSRVRLWLRRLGGRSA